MIRVRIGAGLMLGVLLAAGGCTETSESTARTSAAAGRRPGEYASRRLPGVSLAQAQPVADQAFRMHFRVDPTVSTASVLVAYPAEAPELEQSGQAGDVLSITPRRKRRVAELRLASEGATLVVQIRVMTQRLSTTERAAFAGTRGDDRPTQTAIDRQGPASPDAREEWVDWRRDRKVEEEILREIQLTFAETQPAAS